MYLFDVRGWRGWVCWSVQHPRVKTDECKDKQLFPARLYPSNDTDNAFKYNFFPFPHTLSFALLYPSTSIMCFKTIPVVSRPRSNITRRRQSNPANLHHISTSSTTPLSFSMALWNCQSVVNKADLISAFSLQSTLSILGWKSVQKTQQPQLPSLTISLSLTPHVRLAGVGALVCSFQIIGNTQPTRPYAITTHLNLMRLL